MGALLFRGRLWKRWMALQRSFLTILRCCSVSLRVAGEGNMSEEPTEEDRAEFDRLAREMMNDTDKLIGKGITAWSKGEGLLVDIAAMLLKTEREKAGLVLYSINNFHTWLSIIEELFALDLRYTPLRPDWIKISKRLKKCNDVRVSLAHHALGPGK